MISEWQWTKTRATIRKFKDAGYFHDIGKIIIEPELLNHEGTFTEDQHKIIEQHTVVGYRILNLFEETLELAEGVLYHHENWDGSGYPRGLKGEEIPELARVIRIAESYDYLVNKSGIPIKEALAKIKAQAGIIFDPQITDIFIKMIQEKTKYIN